MTITYLLHEDRLYSCFIFRLYYALYYTGKTLITSHDIFTKIINTIQKLIAYAIKTHFYLRQRTTASLERSDQTRRPSHCTQVKSHTHVHTDTHTTKSYYILLLYTQITRVCVCVLDEKGCCVRQQRVCLLNTQWWCAYR